MTARPPTRLALRALSYALALGCGAGLAHATRTRDLEPRAPSDEAVHPASVVSSAKVARETTNEDDDGVGQPSPVEAHVDVASPESPERAYADGKIIEGGTPHRLILFTFDDGPDRRTTPLLLDRLDEAGVKAVFFLTASRIRGSTQAERDQAALAREIHARGHVIGNHTVDHQQLPLLDERGLTEQVIGAEALFERALGFAPALFRPPGGAHSPRTNAFLAARGYTSVLWNIGTGDFQVNSAQQVFDTFVKVLERRERENGERGGIVLMHDTYAWSVDAFQMIYAELWRRNCQLLQRGEELYEIVSDPSLFYQPRGDADGSAIAEPARLTPDELDARQAGLRLEAAQRCHATDGL